MVKKTWKTAGDHKDLGHLFIDGNEFLCHVCGSGRLLRRRVILTNKLLSFGVGVPDQEVECFECGGCEYLHWFGVSEPDSETEGGTD
ncbi:MAG: hypothetical protein HQ582_00190 [Planctomycetes bacterium]|nr:hypothetical protein [Planctomycetota bacterium]